MTTQPTPGNVARWERQQKRRAEQPAETVPHTPQDGYVQMRNTRGLGDYFADAHPELFKGCGCRKGVLKVMNRWNGQVREDQIGTVVNTIASKNRNVSRGKIDQLLRDFLNATD